MTAATLVCIRELLADNEKTLANARDMLWHAISENEERYEDGEEDAKARLETLRELYEKASRKYFDAAAAREEFERHEFN